MIGAISSQLLWVSSSIDKIAPKVSLQQILIPPLPPRPAQLVIATKHWPLPCYSYRNLSLELLLLLAQLLSSLYLLLLTLRPLTAAILLSLTRYSRHGDRAGHTYRLCNSKSTEETLAIFVGRRMPGCPLYDHISSLTRGKNPTNVPSVKSRSHRLPI